MSHQKLTPAASRPNTTHSPIPLEDSINLYNRPYSKNSSIISNNKKSVKSSIPSQQQSEKKPARSKSPVVKTYKELRSVSPNRVSHDYSYLNTSVLQREKVYLNASQMMDKESIKSDDFKEVLRKVFGFYASFGDRINKDALTANNLVKLVHDAGLIDKVTLNLNAVNILFFKHSLKTNSIDLDKFLLIVIDIAAMKYPDISQKDAFFRVFNEYFKPLYYSLYTETSLGEHDVIFQEPVEPETIAILAEIAPVLARLYRYVFACEYQHSDYKTAKAKSELQLPFFFKEFDLSPFIINLNLGHALFREVLNVDKNYLKQNFSFPILLEKDQGIAFTLRKFLLYLIRLAIIGFSASLCQDLAEGDLDSFSQQDKLALLLEKMEVSGGFGHFRKSISTTYSGNASLLPSKATMKKLLIKRKARTGILKNLNLDTSQCKTQEDYYQNNIITEPQITQHDNECILQDDLYMTNELFAKKRTLLNRRSVSPNKQPQTLELLPNTKQVLDSYRELLLDIFKAYCTYLSSKSDTAMTVSGLVNLFKDAGLIKEVKEDRRLATVAEEDSKGDQTSFIDKQKILNQTHIELYIKRQLAKPSNIAQRASRVGLNKSFDIYQVTEEGGDDNGQNSARQKGMSFELFLKTVEYVAVCNYPDIDEGSAVKMAIENNLQRVLKGERLVTLGHDAKGQLKQLMEILRDPLLMDLIAMIKKRMQPFYKEYCAPKEEFVGFEGFLKFYQFYGIFPQLVSRVKLIQLFHNLAALYPLLGGKQEDNQQNQGNARSTSKKENNENKGRMIDENLFVESIIICALIADESSERNTAEKVLCLVGKMNENLAILIFKQREAPFALLELKKKQKALLDILNYIQSKGTDVPVHKTGYGGRRIKRFEDLFDNES